MKKILLFTACVFISFCSTAQNLDEIVNKHILAIGGRDNWAKLKTLKMYGNIKAQGADIKITISQVDKVAVRQDIEAMGMTGYNIITTTEGWNFMPFQGQTKPEPITAEELKHAQDDLYLQDEFITYKELGKKIEYIGKDDIDGSECHKIKMTDKNAQETTYYIDTDNYYVIKQTDKMKVDGKEMENSTTFGNYKKLDEGIVYPMSITAGWGETEIVKLEVNPKLDMAMFKLPK